MALWSLLLTSQVIPCGCSGQSQMPWGQGHAGWAPLVLTVWKVLWVRILERGGCFFVTFLPHFMLRANILLPDYESPQRQGPSHQSKCSSVGEGLLPGSPPLRPWVGRAWMLESSPWQLTLC